MAAPPIPPRAPHLRPVRAGDRPTPPVPPRPRRRHPSFNPEFLTREARLEYARLVDVLEAEAAGAFNPELDGPGVALAAQAYGFAAQAAGRMETLVDNDPGAGNRLRKHPLFSMFRESSNLYLNYARAYGLTPDARRRLDLLSDHRPAIEDTDEDADADGDLFDLPATANDDA